MLGWAEQILGNKPVPDETEEGAEGILRPFGSLGNDGLTVTESSYHLCSYLPLGHLLQEALQHLAMLSKPFFLWAPLNGYFVVFLLTLNYELGLSSHFRTRW